MFRYLIEKVMIRMLIKIIFNLSNQVITCLLFLVLHLKMPVECSLILWREEIKDWKKEKLSFNSRNWKKWKKRKKEKVKINQIVNQLRINSVIDRTINLQINLKTGLLRNSVTDLPRDKKVNQDKKWMNKKKVRKRMKYKESRWQQAISKKRRMN